MGIGLDLKTAREAAKIPLEAIQQKTKISLTYLEAIERDDWTVFPSHTFARGFLRAYAKMVKVDPMLATRQFNEEVAPQSVTIEPNRVEIFPETNWSFARKPKPGAPVSDAPPPPQDLALEFDEGNEGDEHRTVAKTLFTRRTHRKSALPWKAWGTLALNGVGIALLVWLVYAGGAAAYRAAKNRHHRHAASAAAPVDSTPVPGAATATPVKAVSAHPAKTSPTPEVPATPTLQATRPQTATPPAFVGQAPRDKYHHLTLKGLDSSWVQVTADGKAPTEWMLEPGAVKFFKAVGGFTVKIGNAAGVDAQLDGTSLGVLGANGKVVELNLPKGYVPPSKP